MRAFLKVGTRKRKQNLLISVLLSLALCLLMGNNALMMSPYLYLCISLLLWTAIKFLLSVFFSPMFPYSSILPVLFLIKAFWERSPQPCQRHCSYLMVGMLHKACSLCSYARHFTLTVACPLFLLHATETLISSGTL